MRPHGSCKELEERRYLAIARVLDGYTPDEVADFLGVESRSVYRWLAAFRQAGEAGLAALPMEGRPPKLTLGAGSRCPRTDRAGRSSARRGCARPRF